LYAEMGNTAAALADFDRSLQLEPDNPSCYNERGMVWREAGEYLKAEQDFTQALALDARFFLLYVNRGVVRLLLHREVEAEQDFQMVLQMRPDMQAFVAQQKMQALRAK